MSLANHLNHNNIIILAMYVNQTPAFCSAGYIVSPALGKRVWGLWPFIDHGMLECSQIPQVHVCAIFKYAHIPVPCDELDGSRDSYNLIGSVYIPVGAMASLVPRPFLRGGGERAWYTQTAHAPVQVVPRIVPPFQCYTQKRGFGFGFGFEGTGRG